MSLFKWEETDELVRRWAYESYCADIWYENGDNAPVLSYEEWCKESEELGEPLCPSI